MQTVISFNAKMFGQHDCTIVVSVIKDIGVVTITQNWLGTSEGKGDMPCQANISLDKDGADFLMIALKAILS